MTNGEQSYIEAVQIILNEGVNKEALSLLLKALDDGISEKKDEGMAYAYIADYYVHERNYSRAYDAYKKAFSIKQQLPKDMYSDYDKFWNVARNRFGLLLCTFAEEAEGAGQYTKATEYYDEAINYTDHPLAHTCLAIIQGATFEALNEKKQLDNAINHLKYVIENKDLLPSYKDMDKLLETAQENLEKLEAKKSKSGCFIATAVYGDIVAPEVICLRQYRDTVLNITKTGRAFIKLYSFISPSLAGIVSKSRLLKIVIRKFILDPFVSLLKRLYTNLQKN